MRWKNSRVLSSSEYNQPHPDMSESPAKKKTRDIVSMDIKATNSGVGYVIKLYQQVAVDESAGSI